MNARDCSTAELLRIIGEERACQRPEDVSEAETELIARLGGPFTLTGWAGRAELLVRCLIGLCMAALAVTALRGGLESAGSLLRPGRGNTAATVTVLAGLAFLVTCLLVVGGILLVARWNPRDRLGRGALKLAGGRLSVGRGDPWRVYWVRVVGVDRRSHSEGEVGEALQRIRQVHGERLRATRRNMRFLALLGACLGLLGTRQAATYLPGLLRSGPIGAGFPLLGPAPSWVLGICGLAVQAAWGLSVALLFVGCGGLLFCRDWARKMLACVFATWIVLSVFDLELTVSWRLFLGTRLPGVGSEAAVVTLWLVVTWDLFRAVVSPSVREVCGEERDAGPDGRSPGATACGARP